MRPVIFACAALCLAAAPPTVSAQPKKGDTTTTHVGGKTLEEWIEEIGHKDPSRKENAIRTVLLFGPERAYGAVKPIVAQLKKHTASTPVDVSVRVNGVIALGVILGGVKDADAKLTKDAVAVVKRFVTDPQALLRYRAVQALGRIGAEAREAIPEVSNALKDPATWEVRAAAAGALGHMARDDKNAPVKVLVDLFGIFEKESSSQVRLAAIQSLTWLGAPSEPDVKLSLLKALDGRVTADPDPAVQIWAQMAFMSAAKEFQQLRMDFIAKMLKHKEAFARAQAAQALGTLGREAKNTAPALIAALTDEEPVVVGWSIWALARLERSALGAVPALQRISKDKDQPEPLRKAAEEAIEQINGKTK